ncbi:hypothetical protein GJAV_G00126320 [Gymnothorax javanicus]|nr:hypothetical protein GJAV_G00126320 [Gymnothorax javanicus]
MLQQILKDMYIDPDVLQALNEEQKKTLFLKMRQEQVRRWKEHEEMLEREGASGVRPKPRTAHCKKVSWLLGRDGDVHVCVIGEADELKDSKLIYPGLGERKGSSNHKATRCQTNLPKSNVVSRACAGPVRDEMENLPPASKTGIRLNLRGSTEESKPSAHWRPLQEAKTASDAAKHPVIQDSSCQSKLHHGSRPISNSDLRHPDPGGRHQSSLAITARLRPQDSQQQQQQCDRGSTRTFRLTPASRRGLEGAVLDGKGEDVIGRGRVAQLMKNFNAPSNNKLAPPLSKPALPSKPTHLACPSVR